MEVSEALYTTRAMRRLDPRPVPDDVIARIIDAGVHAPCPGATQPWRFVVVTDRETMTAIGQVWRAARDEVLRQIPNLYHRAEEARSSGYLYNHIDDVPVMIFGYGPEGLGALTVVPALWSMCVAARGEGVGSTFTTLLTRAEPDVNKILGVPADAGVKLFGVLPMGYPLGRWGVANRQPAHEVSFANQWGTDPPWRAATPTW